MSEPAPQVKFDYQECPNTPGGTGPVLFWADTEI